MRQIEVVRKDLAPLQVKVFAVLIVLATIYKMVTWTFHDVHPLVFVLSNMVAYGIWSAKDILMIDFNTNQIKEGFKIFGLSYTDGARFGVIEKIFIKKVHGSEIFRHLTRTMIIRHENYKAFLKTSDGDKYCLAIHGDKDQLIMKLKVINENLKTEIFDYSETEQIKVV